MASSLSLLRRAVNVLEFSRLYHLRLELILGFRGCRREMHMEAENTISIALRSHIPLRSCLVGIFPKCSY